MQEQIIQTAVESMFTANVERNRGLCPEYRVSRVDSLAVKLLNMVYEARDRAKIKIRLEADSERRIITSKAEQ